MTRGLANVCDNSGAPWPAFLVAYGVAYMCKYRGTHYPNQRLLWHIAFVAAVPLDMPRCLFCALFFT